jgi:hypothetical protein
LVLTRDSAYGITNIQMPSGNVLIGTTTDDGVNKLQINGPTTGYGLAVYRSSNASQYIGLASSPTPTNNANVIDSYSAANNAKTLVLNSTTDSSNTAPTAGTLGIQFAIQGSIKGGFSQAGHLTVGTTSDDGVNMLQVSGTIAATTPTAGTNNTQVATTAFVATSFAPIANPTFTGRVYIPEGTASAPGLSFVNDGAIDTGLYHISDGVFGITCNTVSQVQFSNSSGTTFATAVTANSGISTTTLTTSGAITANSVNTGSATITGGSINSTPVGATTPSTGKFTTLTTTGTTTFGGRTVYAGATYTAAGTTQATGTAITTDLCFVSAGAASSGVVLPPVAMGATCFVVNYSGNSIVVYPPSGAYLDFGAQNAGSTMANQTRLMFCSDGGSWFSMNATYA